jgi:hypothetical protein
MINGYQSSNQALSGDLSWLSLWLPRNLRFAVPNSVKVKVKFPSFADKLRNTNKLPQTKKLSRTTNSKGDSEI